MKQEKLASTTRWRERLSRMNWRSNLRWFVAETIIVVMGVLIALAINSSWSDHQDRVREQSYIREIIRNLRATDSSLSDANQGLTQTRQATSALLQATHNRRSVIPDSLVRWLFDAQYISLPTFSMGAVNALVQTGDLHLVRDDSSRLSIMRTIDAVDETKERESFLVSSLILPILQRQRERTALTNLYKDFVKLDLDTDNSDYARMLASALPDTDSEVLTSNYASLLENEDALTDWRVISDHLVVLQRQYQNVHEVVKNARQQLENGLIE